LAHVVQKNDKYGVVDSGGKVVIPLIYDNLYHGSDGGYFLAWDSKDLCKTAESPKTPVTIEEAIVLAENKLRLQAGLFADGLTWLPSKLRSSAKLPLPASHGCVLAAAAVTGLRSLPS